MQKRNCFTALLCVAVFLFFFFQCGKQADTAAYWPRMICIAGLFLSCLEIVLEGIKWKGAKEEQEKLLPLNAAQTRRSLALLAILVLWAAGLNTIGFMVSSMLAVCAIAVLFEAVKTRGKIIRDVCIGAAFAAAMYVMFKYLGIHFPKAFLM